MRRITQNINTSKKLLESSNNLKKHTHHNIHIQTHDYKRLVHYYLNPNKRIKTSKFPHLMNAIKNEKTKTVCLLKLAEFPESDQRGTCQKKPHSKGEKNKEKAKRTGYYPC